MINALAGPAAAVIGAAWITIIATAAIVFRRRVVAFLVRLAAPREDPAAQTRDLSIGVVLLAVFAYVLAAVVASLELLPADIRLWPMAIGIPILVVVNLLYWFRFANAGLSVVSWMRR
ncbi:hypothetical protein ACFVWR_07040 [Leifsonia sp. NPDC058292]|uniref:hypothetical protein n=1 Tax=Leifsonia sp. NPDC058292 TaxID=3346428 RepID=UPI0036DC9EAD